MTTPSRLAAWLLLLWAVGSAPAPGAGAEAPRPKNLLILLADDLRWDTLGFAGHRVVRTPHLDRLAAEGAVFQNAFCTTSICSVSRASVFSGQYARRHGIHDFATGFSPAAWSETYPSLLRRAGYRIGFIGKFGVGNEMPEQAFDYWAGFPGQGRYDGGPEHLTARMGNQAIEFFRSQPRGQPFCLSISFKAPHAQDGAPREFLPDPRDLDLYARVPIPMPPTAVDSEYRKMAEFVRLSEGRTRWQRRFATPDQAQETVRDYLRLITGMDREIGRMREALRALELDGETVILFTSDNGFFLGEKGLAGKWLMYEESIRIPLVVHAPGMKPQAVRPMALNIDVAPTLLDYAGVPVSGRMQGRSLRGWVEGKRVRDWRPHFFYEHLYAHGGRIPQTEGVREERMKYLRYVSADPVVEELYDLRRDPAERNNLAGNPGMARELKRLRELWSQLSSSLL